MTDEIPVDLVAYDAAWRQLYDEESIRISHALVIRATRIAHVGSTAVPGLLAAPVIDVMVGVERYPPTPAFIAPLETLGYAACGERGLSGRLCYTKREPIAVDLHLVQFNGRLWKGSLLLRNYLSGNPKVARAYEQRKREILAAGHTDAMTYAQYKASALAQLLDEAARWKPSLAATPTAR
jgi:GrpB-like predicted nucleotidyltransferase (UPF0157 family)